ncbi:MAG: hypothetical protein MZV70_41630 [Desulfobacterales bacterium]|nr:hypothetical protein [Desulfobacterales bacterium]
MTSQRFFRVTGRVIAIRLSCGTGRRLTPGTAAGRPDQRSLSVDTS